MINNLSFTSSDHHLCYCLDAIIHFNTLILWLKFLNHNSLFKGQLVWCFKKLNLNEASLSPKRAEQKRERVRYRKISAHWRDQIHGEKNKSFYIREQENFTLWLLLDVNMAFNDKVLRNLVAFYWSWLLSQWEIEHTLYWLADQPLYDCCNLW